MKLEDWASVKLSFLKKALHRINQSSMKSYFITHLSNIHSLNSKLVSSAFLKFIKWWPHGSQHDFARLSFFSKQLNIKISVWAQNLA